MICKHEGWGRYEGEDGAQPAPVEMLGPCEHNLECPKCRFRFSLTPCGHEFTSKSMGGQTYRIAVDRPMEVR